MALRQTLTVLTLALSAPLSGCSSDTGDGTSEPANKWGTSALPCNINSGYAGDDVCILPPPDGAGFQMHYGPNDYNDTAQVAKFLLQPGEERTDCIFVDTPNETEIFYNEYHGRMRPGSHHMLLYVEDGVDKPDSTQPGPCAQGPNTRNIFGSQEQVIDVKRQNSAPENEG